MKLWCTDLKDTDKKCRTLHMPWADGTSCDSNKVKTIVTMIQWNLSKPNTGKSKNLSKPTTRKSKTCLNQQMEYLKPV